jgi:cyanophycin synthetase
MHMQIPGYRVDISLEEEDFDRFAAIDPTVLPLFENALPTAGGLQGLSGARDLFTQLLLGLVGRYDAAAAKADFTETSDRRRARILFACNDHYFARIAVRFAAKISNELLSPSGLGIEAAEARIHSVEQQCELLSLDRYGRSIARLGRERGIPAIRLALQNRYVQLGQGHKQQLIFQTSCNRQGALNQQVAWDKFATLKKLHLAGVPVGRFNLVNSAAAAQRTAASYGVSVVLKTQTGRHGDDVFVDLNDAEAIAEAADHILRNHSSVLLQEFFAGHDHRILVIDGQFVAATRRLPGQVVGDGRQTVAELLAAENRARDRNKDFHSKIVPMAVDAEMQSCLARQGLELQSVAAAGQSVKLRRMANIAQGGTSIDFTDTIHPDNICIAERAAKVIGLAVGGVDFITPDITRSWKEVGGGFCEVNATPGLRVHWVGNKNLDVVTPIVNMLFPDNTDGRIPTAMITGSHDRLVVCDVLTRILSADGQVVGTATSTAAKAGDNILIDGDATGILAAHTVLSDPTVTAAILEIALDNRLDQGLYLEYADAAVLTDIAKDGDRVKAEKVLQATRKAVILNVDDPASGELRGRFPVAKLILCAGSPDNSAVIEHLAAGGRALTYQADTEGGPMILRQGADEGIPIRLPDTHGQLSPTVLLLAVAAAIGLSIPPAAIAAGLETRTP